jgi:hypothetical protein
MAPSGLPIPQVNHIELRSARRGLSFSLMTAKTVELLIWLHFIYLSG